MSSELLMCSRGVRSILLLPLVARCLETLDACIWRMLVFMSVAVPVGMFVGVLACCIGVLNYVVCLCKGCGGCYVFCLYCEAWSYRCLWMGSMSFFSTVFCVICSLLIFVSDASGDHTVETSSSRVLFIYRGHYSLVSHDLNI